MKIKEGFVLRELLNEYIVVGEGVSQINFNRIVSMNESSAYLWRSVEGKEFTVDDLRDLLLDRYEVSEETAAEDAAAIAQKWIDAGIAE